MSIQMRIDGNKFRFHRNMGVLMVHFNNEPATDVDTMLSEHPELKDNKTVEFGINVAERSVK